MEFKGKVNPVDVLVVGERKPLGVARGIVTGDDAGA